MFVGHFAAGIAARAASRRLPLWVGIAASQLIDIGWAGLLIAGVEKMRVVPTLPGNPLDLYYMPYTHSLPAALVWALAAALLARGILGLPSLAASLVGAVVASHWLFDLLVHRPDLALLPQGPKVGLGLWNFPIPEMVLEMGLLGLSIAVLASIRRDRGQKAWPVIGLFVLLCALQGSAALSAAATDPVAQGSLALFAFGVAIAGALGVDLYDRRQRRINAVAVAR